MKDSPRVILVDSSEETREALAGRLRMQGYTVEVADSPAAGAHLALSNPPAVVVADLWMPSISGVQLCRLLKSEAATEHVPVILRGPWGHRDRFWAERAGASSYVAKGRMGDLVRAIATAIADAPPREEEFFTHLAGEDVDIRDRIATHLDAALFESVLASEVRALGSCGELERLFDLFTQLLTQLSSYRWVALSTAGPERFAIHCPSSRSAACTVEAREALKVSADVPAMLVEDDDAYDDETGPGPIVRDIQFGHQRIGRIALAPRENAGMEDSLLMDVVAREIGGPIRMATLVEESQRLARVDALTHLLNRRAFAPSLEIEIARSERHGWPLCILLMDVDHFKGINDVHGHGTGDVVLAAVGKLLQAHCRKVDLPARWGGEEFVVALTGTDEAGAKVAAERIRRALEELQLTSERGEPLRVTASIGVAQHASGDTLESLVDRADRAMYEAKAAGRNRVQIAPTPARAARRVA